MVISLPNIIQKLRKLYFLKVCLSFPKIDGILPTMHHPSEFAKGLITHREEKFKTFQQHSRLFSVIFRLTIVRHQRLEAELRLLDDSLPLLSMLLKYNYNHSKLR